MGKRIMIASAVVILLLAACSSVPEARPGQLLYVTTFDAFTEDWQLYEGELAARIMADDGNPRLEIAVDSIQAGAFTLLDQAFGDFDVITDVVQVAGPDNLDAPGFGVLFRHQDNNNFYAFMISGDGYYQVIRRQDGVGRLLFDAKSRCHPGCPAFGGVP